MYGKTMLGVLSACLVVLSAGCSTETPEKIVDTPALTPDFVLTNDQTHTKFSRLIKPVIRVLSGSVIEAFTHECTGGQLSLNSTVEDAAKVDWDRIHTLTGPVYVKGAERGDVPPFAFSSSSPPTGDGWRSIRISGSWPVSSTRPCCRPLRSTPGKTRSSSRMEFASP